MKTAILDEQSPRTYLLVFDPGEEVMKGLLAFVKEKNLTAGHLTAIGAVSSAVLGYFDRATKDYKRIPQDGQAEVLSLIGDVALKDDGGPGVHVHAVLGLPDGTTRGGHLIEAKVWPTLEVVLTESPKHLKRTFRPELGLALIDLK
jgi:predicted DNA-binding protein with PD1-like motif